MSAAIAMGALSAGALVELALAGVIRSRADRRRRAAVTAAGPSTRPVKLVKRH